MGFRLFLWILTFVVCAISRVVADVTLVDTGKAQCSIYVAPRIMAADIKVADDAVFAEREAELQRQRLRESVNDLALYLQKMSGAKVEVLQRTPQATDKRIPILIAEYARQRFGEMRQKTSFKQGWRMTISKNGIGLQGESDEAASYAIYEVLDRFGCRWFVPGAMGESIPHRSTLGLPEGDISGAPSTAYRGVWYADNAFKRRNRMGGFEIKANHALELYITEQQRQQHPEWRAIVEGKPHPKRLKWSNPEVANAIADAIIAKLDKNYVPSVSLSPDDGISLDESDDKALDAGDWDPTMDQVSATDRLVVLCNRIAERVTKKYPDVQLGFLAYVQYTRPPVREKLHPNLVPQIAPISYCRAHAMTDACSSRSQLRPILDGWRKAAKRVSYYNYMYNLAEVSAPYPMMHQMSEELPILYKNNVEFWQPETITNFEAVLPGMWLSLRMAWNKNQSPEQILNEFFTRYYGNAEKPMRRYWQTFDDAWIKVPAHSGGLSSYTRRFTPEVLQQARAAMNEALVLARTPVEVQRVTIQERSLRQFERFMQMRRDLNEGRLGWLDRQGLEWLGTQIGLGAEYSENYAFTKIDWAGADFYTQAGLYYKWFMEATNNDAARIGRQHYALGPPKYFVISPPLRQWKYAFHDKPAGRTISATPIPEDLQHGETAGWYKADFDDSAWKTTDTGIATWSDLGYLDKLGTMWYRQKVNVPITTPGKKVYLWIAATDGAAKVFVNGKHIPYVNAKGEKSDAAVGYAEPFSFDVTDTIKPGAENQITVAGTRLDLINEVGTGGLLGPAYLYIER